MDQKTKSLPTQLGFLLLYNCTFHWLFLHSDFCNCINVDRDVVAFHRLLIMLEGMLNFEIWFWQLLTFKIIESLRKSMRICCTFFLVFSHARSWFKFYQIILHIIKLQVGYDKKNCSWYFIQLTIADYIHSCCCVLTCLNFLKFFIFLWLQRKFYVLRDKMWVLFLQRNVYLPLMCLHQMKFLV